ncbi:MAG: DUF4430 domain-containing protein [Candidatus Thermoplasmatota archaeon]|jgi:flagellar basal body-associated protein FliL|nr:DUF4430 domain-containing protein [Candidatus Thermoplasmatota archaeon]
MNQKQKDRLIFALKLLIPLIIVVSLFIAGVSTGIITFELPIKNVNTEQINATIIIDFGDGEQYSKVMTISNSTIYDFLLEVSKTGDITVETFYSEQNKAYVIKSITYQEKNYIHGENGCWWLFYINDQFATDAADKIYVNNNDVIKWKYEKF